MSHPLRRCSVLLATVLALFVASPAAAAVPAAPVLTAQALNGAVGLCVNSDPNVTSYTIVRGGVVRATGVTSFPHTDPGRVNGTPYTYLVRAVNASGTSADSNSVTVTPLASAPSTASPCSAPPATLAPDYDTKWGQSGGWTCSGSATASGCSFGPFSDTHHPEHVYLVNDPAGLSRTVARFDAYRSDTGATTNPRVQLELPQHINQGDEEWQGLSFYLPSTFPTTVDNTGTEDKFITHTSYGSNCTATNPCQGTAKVSYGSYAGTYKFGARLSGSGKFAWALTPQRSKWYDVIIHSKVTSDAATGFTEAWVNSGSGFVKQQILPEATSYGSISADGTRFLGATATADPADYPLDGRIDLYYSVSLIGPDPLRMYFGPSKWRKKKAGETDVANMEAVNPHTYG